MFQLSGGKHLFLWQIKFIQIFRLEWSCDFHSFHRIALSAVNMELTDYDIRTALHVASAEGNEAILHKTIQTFRVRNLFILIKQGSI